MKMLLRVALLVACALAMTEARKRPDHPLPHSTEFISSECYKKASPYMTSIRDSLHNRRHKIREGCHDEAYLLSSKVMKITERHNQSVTEACAQDKHSELCRYLMKHLPFGAGRGKSFVITARHVHEICSSTLSLVVADMTDEAVQLMKILGHCAPHHACYLYQMTQDYMRHVATHIRRNFQISTQVKTVCSLTDVIVPDRRLASACNRYTVAHSTLQRINTQWESMFTDPKHQGCDVAAKTVATTIVTKDATSQVAESPTKKSALSSIETAAEETFNPKQFQDWVVKVENTHSHTAMVPSDAISVVTTAPEQKKPAGLYFSGKYKRSAFVTASIAVAVMVLVVIIVALISGRRRRLAALARTSRRTAETSSRGPLLSKDEQEKEELMKVKQFGFENPAYSFYEDLATDEKI